MPVTIDDVYAQFEPLNALLANDPRYVDCVRERGIPALFSRLTLPLTSNQPRALLFSGHMGDGKSTLLRQLQDQLEKKGDFVAVGEADDRLDLSDVEYDDVLLAILAIIDETLRARYQKDAGAGPFLQIWHELSRIAQLPVDLGGQANVPLGPFSKITATVKDAPDVRLQVRQSLRQARGPTFIEVVNDYVRRAQILVRQKGHRHLVVILDNLDRLPETLLPGEVYPDEKLFLGQAAQLLGVQCHVIYTVRLALAHAQSPTLEVRYGQPPLIVPMTPVRHPDGTPHEQGLARLREIIERRVQAAGAEIGQVFRDEEIARLCQACGGHLRELMTLVRMTCETALTLHGDLPFTATDVEMAIQQIGAQRRNIAANYREALTKVARIKRLDEVPPEIHQVLLRHRLVYEYFEGQDYWYDVCPLCSGS